MANLTGTPLEGFLILCNDYSFRPQLACRGRGCYWKRELNPEQDLEAVLMSASDHRSSCRALIMKKRRQVNLPFEIKPVEALVSVTHPVPPPTAVEKGHNLQLDFTGKLSSVTRWECVDCGRAVLVSSLTQVIYGRATTEECEGGLGS